MKLKLLFTIAALCTASFAMSQTKVSGEIFDASGNPVPFANVIFVGSNEGTITNENGRFYLESANTWNQVRFSFIGFSNKILDLTDKVSYNLKVTLEEESGALKEVVIFSGKTDKKNNPAVDILRKIWQNKRQNGLKQYDQYAYDKYEKLEFDLNTIDSALINSKLFRGMEFIFEETDTSRITGKTYLPIFVNEAISKVYGDNLLKKEKEVLEGNKNSGFSENQTIIGFVKGLYSDYDIYDNYLQFFDKSFTSPISRTGIQTYNYVLSDSAYIDNKWCYNIIYYPRRKNELTFKGDFWVNDSTWAIKEINMQLSKSANVNWVKEIFMEQEFEIVNDSTFLLSRDYFLSDFAFNKKEASRGLYGKRTTLYDNHVFDVPVDKAFYDKEVYNYDKDIYNRDDDFWETNRLEKLNDDEKSVYKMLDTLKTVKKFKNLYNLGSVLATGYYEVPSLNIDYGPIFSTFGFNEVEGLRVRVGGRTYFSENDLWRLEGFAAYGFKDQKGKFGISGKWLLDKKNRFIISGGYRQDVEQIGASLTTSRDVLGRNLASSSLVNTATNDKLTSIQLVNVAAEIEVVRNLKLRTDFSLRTLSSASETFSLDYFTDASQTTTGELTQAEVVVTSIWEPGKKTSGFGVERRVTNEWFPTLQASYTRGLEGTLDSDFGYDKLQFSARKAIRVGGFGTLTASTEVGKTFDEVPLALLSPVPGNQSLFSIFNTFSQLNFYEFTTDEYLSVQLEHNFGGRIFNRIPLLRSLNLREIVSIRGIVGSITQGNIDLNRPAFESLLFEEGDPITPITPDIIAPSQEPYYEYSVGVGNIFKVFRLDLNFRGNYNSLPDARKVGVTGSFGFYF